MKKVYFVGHGESIGNASNWRQGPQGGLSELGKKQAKVLAGRFKDIPVDLIISSSLDRAIETTEIIASQLQKKYLTSDLFVEHREASIQMGVERGSPEDEKILAELKRNTLVSDYRHSDEENFEDTRSRAIEARDFILGREEEIILIVSHGFFMKMLLGVIINENIDRNLYQNISRVFTTMNTGITLFDIKDHGDWRLRTWSDHAHLGEIKD